MFSREAAREEGRRSTIQRGLGDTPLETKVRLGTSWTQVSETPTETHDRVIGLQVGEGNTHAEEGMKGGSTSTGVVRHGPIEIFNIWHVQVQ